MRRPEKSRNKTTKCLQITALITLTALCLAQPVQAGWCDWCEEKMLRPLGKVVEKTAEATQAVVEATVNVGEATVNVVTGDLDSAKKAGKRFEANTKKALKNGGKVAETTAKMTYDATVEAPIRITARAIDEISDNGGQLDKGYKEIRDSASREIRKSGQVIGQALEVAIQPENLGRIAVVYIATSTGGPLGAALANAVYDKLTNPNIDDKTLAKSFAAGLVAGYAAQGVESALATKGMTGYSVSAAVGVTNNVARSAVNGELSSKKLLTSVATGLIAIDSGEQFSDTVVDAALEAGLENAVAQAIANDFQKISLEEVGQALAQGGANAAVTAGVHASVDAAHEEYQEAYAQTLEALQEQQGDTADEASASPSPAETEPNLRNDNGATDKVYDVFASLSPEEKEQILRDGPKFAAVTVPSNRGSRGVPVPGAADRGSLLGEVLYWVELGHAHREQKKVDRALDEYAKTVAKGEQVEVDAWIDEGNNFIFLAPDPVNRPVLSNPRWKSSRYTITGTGTNFQKGEDKKLADRKAQKELDKVLNEYTAAPQLGPVLPDPSSHGEGLKELDEALNLPLPGPFLGPVPADPLFRGDE